MAPVNINAWEALPPPSAPPSVPPSAPSGIGSREASTANAIDGAGGNAVNTRRKKGNFFLRKI
jgi:hypothetical protein